MQKTPFVFPIVGCRKIEQLQANIDALTISLSEEQIKYLESILPFDPGFPHNFCVSDLLPCFHAKATHMDNRTYVGRRLRVHPHDPVGWKVRQVAASTSNPPLVKEYD